MKYIDAVHSMKSGGKRSEKMLLLGSYLVLTTLLGKRYVDNHPELAPLSSG